MLFCASDPTFPKFFLGRAKRKRKWVLRWWGQDGFWVALTSWLPLRGDAFWVILGYFAENTRFVLVQFTAAQDQFIQRNESKPMQPEMSYDDEKRWMSYYRSLREWAAYLVGPRLGRRLDQSDLAHEAWVAAWISREQFNGTTPEEWNAWLRGILRNTLNNSIRAHSAQERDLRREVFLPNRLDESWSCVDAMFFGKEPNPLQRLERQERMAQFIEAVAGLSAKEQTVVRLRLFEELKLVEIAKLLDEPLGAIAGRLARAIRKLQQRLAGMKE